MSREQFVERKKPEWIELETALRQLESAPRRKRDPEVLARVPALYRRVCQDLALARHRQYGATLVGRLNRLALRGHEQIYSEKKPFGSALVAFVARDFPRLVRAEARLFWLGFALFYVPFFGTMLGAYLVPEWSYVMLDEAQVAQVEAMYDPDNSSMKEHRESDSDVLMFGFYIFNNIGIAFRTFASGLAAGLGSIFFLVYNGLALGTIFGHLTRVGYVETLYPFVIGHGAFELTGIHLSGTAGLKMGFSLLAPGRRTRARALVEEGRTCIRLVFGAGGMLLIAAFVEAFWSPTTTPPALRLGVGAVLWLFVAGYFLFAGRNRGA